MTLKDTKLNQVCSVPRSLHPRGELDKKPLFNSILITGGTEKERLKKALEIRNEKNKLPVTPALSDGAGQANYQLLITNDPDFILLASATSIGIDQVRDLQRKLSLKPFQSQLKIAFVLQAQNLTIPAQNALLKTLEEPPDNTIIILSSPHADNLLPTIISRCQIINLPPKPQISQNKDILTAHHSLLATILATRVGERILTIQSFTTNREEAINFCQNTVLLLHNLLKEKIEKGEEFGLSYSQIAILLKSVQKALEYLQKNINVKLVMENMILNW